MILSNVNNNLNYKLRPLSLTAPYAEGISLLAKSCLPFSIPGAPSLTQRGLLILTGIALLIPIVNLVIFAALHALQVNNDEKQIPPDSFSIPHFEESNDEEAIRWRKEFLTCKNFKEWAKLGADQGYLNLRFPGYAGKNLLHVMVLRPANSPEQEQEKKEQIQYLIKLGADLSAQDQHFGNTPLHWAIANAENTKAFTLIQHAGTHPHLDIQCNLGNTALHLSIAKGYKDMSIDKRKLNYSNFQLTQELLQKGANPNLQNMSGDTPLHIACARRDVDSIQALLAAKADKTLQNNNGMTPFDMLNLDWESATKVLLRTTRPFLIDQSEWTKNHQKALNIISSDVIAD